MPKRRQIDLQITVSGPSWMTKAMAKREVRALLGEQCFYGNRNPDGSFDEIDESNFKVRKVK